MINITSCTQKSLMERRSSQLCFNILLFSLSGFVEATATFPGQDRNHQSMQHPANHFYSATTGNLEVSRFGSASQKSILPYATMQRVGQSLELEQTSTFPTIATPTLIPTPIFLIRMNWIINVLIRMGSSKQLNRHRNNVPTVTGSLWNLRGVQDKSTVPCMKTRRLPFSRHLINLPLLILRFLCQLYYQLPPKLVVPSEPLFTIFTSIFPIFYFKRLILALSNKRGH